MTDAPAYLFVYGTLRPTCDAPWSHFLRQFTTHVGPALAPGKMLLIRANRHFQYPAFVPDSSGDGSSFIVGDVLQVKDGVHALKSVGLTPAGENGGTLMECLDSYEGDEYKRTTITVKTVDGVPYTCGVYVWTASTEGHPVIAGGDFLKR
jgi:gamma-glutamylcyclotransferase (GGCT)/AIG2-like uncharacterized protein YtfP